MIIPNVLRTHCELLLLPACRVVSPSGQFIQELAFTVSLYAPISQGKHPDGTT